MLVYSSGDLNILGYTDSDFQVDEDSKKSTFVSVFILNGKVVVCKSIKQIEAEYITASEAAKEAVWLKNFLINLEVVPRMDEPITFTMITVVL